MNRMTLRAATGALACALALFTPAWAATASAGAAASNYAGKEVWELYNLDADPTELIDLAKSQPAKLKELQALFDAEAKKNQVYPLINWSDIFVGIHAFQEKMGFWPAQGSSK